MRSPATRSPAVANSLNLIFLIAHSADLSGKDAETPAFAEDAAVDLAVFLAASAISAWAVGRNNMVGQHVLRVSKFYQVHNPKMLT